MTATISIFLFCLFVLLLLMCIFESLYIKKYPSVRFYNLTGIGTLIWLIFYMFYFVDPNLERAKLWHRLGFIGICFVPPMYIIFINKFINPDFKITKKYFSALYALPFVSIVLVITNPMHHLFYKSVEIVQTDYIRTMITSYAPYFYVHALYYYLLSIFPIYLLIQSKRQKKNLYQEPLTMFLIAFLIGVVINLLSILGIIPFSDTFDYTIIAYFFNHGIFFLAIFLNKTTNLLVLGKETVFDHYSSAAIIVDLNKNIMQMNLVAKDIFNFEFQLNNHMTYDNLIKLWFADKNGCFIEENGEKIALLKPQGQSPLYYKILETPVFDSNKSCIGSFVEMLDVTSNKELINQLYKLVNRDGLTGAYNKRFFNEICQKYNSPEYLPLCIIFGDLNKLKTINDTYGHEIGDEIIVKITDILNDAATDEGSVVCRIGGDEFGIIVPKADQSIANKYIDRVLKACTEMADETVGQVSISLGFSIKNDMNQVLKESIKLADMKMYENKRNRQWNN